MPKHLKLNPPDRTSEPAPDPADEPAPTHTIVIMGTEADADDIAYCLPDLREYRLTDGDPISRAAVTVFQDGRPRFVVTTKADDTLEVVELPELPERS